MLSFLPFICLLVRGSQRLGLRDPMASYGQLRILVRSPAPAKPTFFPHVTLFYDSFNFPSLPSVRSSLFPLPLSLNLFAPPSLNRSIPSQTAFEFLHRAPFCHKRQSPSAQWFHSWLHAISANQTLRLDMNFPITSVMTNQKPPVTVVHH
jgi:hypothetical protein